MNAYVAAELVHAACYLSDRSQTDADTLAAVRLMKIALNLDPNVTCRAETRAKVRNWAVNAADHILKPKHPLYNVTQQVIHEMTEGMK